MAGRGRPKGSTKKKNEEVIKEKKVYPKQVCTMCGVEKDLNANNFYKSYSVLFKGNFESRICICKDCVKILYKQMYSLYETDIKATYETCRTLDIYFDKDLYKSVLNQIENNKGEVISIYVTKVNSLPQYKNKTFINSEPLDREEEKIDRDRINDPVLIKRWGRSYNEEELYFLEQHYAEWCERVDNSALPTDKMIRRICAKELEVENARLNRVQNIDKLEDSLTKLMDNASLTPKTMSATNETESTKVFGVWLREIEKYKPAEFFDKKDLYDDFDGIKDYFNRFVFRPLKNLLCGTREFDKEFFIPDGENNE